MLILKKGVSTFRQGVCQFRWCTVLLGLSTGFTPLLSESQAALGGGLGSLAVNQTRIRLQSPKTYQIYLRTEKLAPGRIFSNPTAIREFTTLEGQVFAFSWRGSHHPDLSLLFGGELFREYLEAENAYQAGQSDPGTAIKTQRRSHRRIRTRNMLIEFSGHMRDVRGKVLVPGLGPAGWSMRSF
jgi:hypothetical protein